MGLLDAILAAETKQDTRREALDSMLEHMQWIEDNLPSDGGPERWADRFRAYHGALSNAAPHLDPENDHGFIALADKYDRQWADLTGYKPEDDDGTIA